MGHEVDPVHSFCKQKAEFIDGNTMNIKHDKRCVVGVFQHIKFP